MGQVKITCLFCIGSFRIKEKSDYSSSGRGEKGSLRVRTACEKLKKTDRSAADIGTECGFASDSAFNRNFRKLMGMSPAEWRKKGENYEQLLLKFDIRTEEGW